MARAGPKKVQRYGMAFKRTAVELSRRPGLQVQTVAEALDIHPFMLSRWRKEFREGRLRMQKGKPERRVSKGPLVREIGRLQELEREHRLLREEHALLKKAIRSCSAGRPRRSGSSRQRGTIAVRRLCALYGVTRAGYYAWRRRPESTRQVQDRVLLQAMAGIFEQSGGTYGSPRLQRALATHGHRISRRRVERLMRLGGWRARVVRVYRRKAGTHRWYGRHPNRVRRTRARRPDQVWVGDVTYLAVGRRWWYLATVLDQYSRRVLAWRLGSIRDSRLTRAAVHAALRRRRPGAGLIFHSDRGSEYVGTSFGESLAQWGVRQSTTRGGAPDENAHIESFFHSLKADGIHGRRFQSVEQLRHHLRRYVRYYNQHRLHSALRYQSPVDYERGAA